MRFDFDWVDAFTDRPFGGNGCAVVHGGAVLSDDICMAYVRETSLVECTFTGPSDVADLTVKYYLASREIPFAGHPTIATVAALRHRGLIGDGPLRLETGAGIVAVDVAGDLITMTQVAPTFGAEIAPSSSPRLAVSPPKRSSARRRSSQPGCRSASRSCATGIPSTGCGSTLRRSRPTRGHWVTRALTSWSLTGSLSKGPPLPVTPMRGF